MSEPIIKKQVAALARTTVKTMHRHRDQYAWLDRCRTSRPGRPTYNRQRVESELRRRKII